MLYPQQPQNDGLEHRPPESGRERVWTVGTERHRVIKQVDDRAVAMFGPYRGQVGRDVEQERWSSCCQDQQLGWKDGSTRPTFEEFG